jgi:SNF2 family DNA or RNA helicase
MHPVLTAPDNHPHKVYVMPGISVASLSAVVIAQHSSASAYDSAGQQEYVPEQLSIDQGLFVARFEPQYAPVVEVMQQPGQLILTCSCGLPDPKLCLHQAGVLLQLIRKDELRLFFDVRLRHERLKHFATDYGLENEPDLDSFFTISYNNQQLTISPKNTSLLPVTTDSLQAMENQMLPAQEPPFARTAQVADDARRFLVLKQHKFYKHLFIELYDAPVTRDGKVKNPLTPVPPLEQVWESNDPLELKFYAAISRFQNNVDSKVTASAFDSLKAIVRNPMNLDCYVHQSAVSESVNASSLLPVKLGRLSNDMEISVAQQDQFYELSAKLKIGEELFNLSDIELKLGYFATIGNTLYLVKDLQMLGTINFFKRRPGNLLIHQSKYPDVKRRILTKLEEKTAINYTYIKPATPAQLAGQGFGSQERIIYLSDFGQHVMILPVLRYGEVEVPIRSDKPILSTDERGKEFSVKRDQHAELQFMALLLKQHEYFEEQLTDDLQYFYLHRKRFLDEDWFLNAFEDWHNEGITILGFNELSNNKLNPHKVKITVRVLSGINWFNTQLNVRFGKRKASLKHLHKAIRNKTKFVQLDDGTQGILPAEWVERFTNYFMAAEVIEHDYLLTPKISYAAISEWYEDEMLDNSVRQELKTYQQKLANFESVKEVPVPAGLQATLRPYQREGLNWLNFLDDLGFGGCLADDMGLGKTIQILAFILSQREKVAHNVNIIVVPTSLIFNWQAEVQKFAPSLKVHTIYGADRIKSTDGFHQYELIITSYGTLLADIGFLKAYEFNYVFLDESQNIKNPDSQRYKSVRLLKSRNKIAITGTPIENNTFDLYAQLSFACPGLLGSKQYFKDIYSSPIDKFKVSRRSAELQQKIRPFILRRTKQQVAAELPEKTEMVLYCEMQPEQRKIYAAYEREFREFISATTQDELPKKSMYVLKGLTKLRQICDSPLLLEGEKLPGMASAKIDTLMEQIGSKSPQHKILVFSQFVTMLDLIRTELEQRQIKFAYLTGSTRNREAVVNSFQDDPDVRVFLISLKAGGTGLNLTAADYVYLVDPWWNPAIENQAIDRCYRIGQRKNVVAVRLICPDTIEEKMVTLQDTKKDLAGQLINADSSIFRSLTRDDLLGMLKQP